MPFRGTFSLRVIPVFHGIYSKAVKHRYSTENAEWQSGQVANLVVSRLVFGDVGYIPTWDNLFFYSFKVC